MELLFLLEWMACFVCSTVIVMFADSRVCVCFFTRLLSLFVLCLTVFTNCLLKAEAVCCAVIIVLLPKVIVLLSCCCGFLLERLPIVCQSVFVLCL